MSKYYTIDEPLFYLYSPTMSPVPKGSAADTRFSSETTPRRFLLRRQIEAAEQWCKTEA
jgi:hypothetical protein